MTLMLTHKHMNLQKSIAVTCSTIIALVLSGNKLGSEAAQTQPGNNRRTFADWCRQKAALSPQIQHTIQMLLKEAGTTDCDVANQKLSSLMLLHLGDEKISDIKPLASLTNLTNLYLGGIDGNNISDIKPLQSLTNLKYIYLLNNLISDIKPLQSLTNLTRLFLSNNQISDINPLQSLTKLNYLYLDNNQINDIKPLESLTNLNYLVLVGNSIYPKNCPFKPDSICIWKPPIPIPGPTLN